MWDIPSSTILAIMPECLPIDAPKALQKEAMALSDAVTSHHDKVAVIDVGGVGFKFGGGDPAQLASEVLAGAPGRPGPV